MSLMKSNPELKSHFLNLYSIALSDTQVDTKELELLFRFGEERGIPREEIEDVLCHPDQIKFSIPSDTCERIGYLYDFAIMIWADNKVDPEEETALRKFCLKFGFVEENVPALVEFLLSEAEKGTDKDTLLNIVKQNL